MSDFKLSASARTEFGKGAARRVRRSGLIPAVVYGHGTDPQHIALPGHATMMALKMANVLLEIRVDGGKELLALAKDVQRDPVKNVIEHVDLVIVKRGEKVQVEVPVQVVGEAGPETFLTLEAPTVLLEVEATNIPEHIEVDVEGKPAGTQILGSDLVLPSGAALVLDPETLIVNISAQISEEALEAELGETEADAGGADEAGEATEEA